MNKRQFLKSIITAVAILTILAAGYLFFYEPEYSGLVKKSDSDKVLVFAHRGFGNYAPDNSLVAARLAIQGGIEGVDIDGQFTADKDIVIFHDFNVDLRKQREVRYRQLVRVNENDEHSTPLALYIEEVLVYCGCSASTHHIPRINYLAHQGNRSKKYFLFFSNIFFRIASSLPVYNATTLSYSGSSLCNIPHED